MQKKNQFKKTNIMKKRNSMNFYRMFLMIGAVALIAFSSCKKDDDDETPEVKNPIASFQFEASTTNYLEVTFTNFSQNATTYSWDFGDGETSTEMNPVHIYSAAGDYTIELTANNSAGTSATFSDAVSLEDPNSALRLLAGESSKTWKLFREGVSMSLGESAESPAGWWEGLQNNGSRPCLYYQSFTFNVDGSYVFDDAGSFWGEYGVFDGLWNFETCFEATAENMINKDGADVSAWLSGTHSFTYDPFTGKVDLTGLGAWMGIPKLGPTGEITIPVASTSFNVSITEETGYDLMTIGFNYGDAGYWQIVYASYSDASLEPDVEEEAQAYGEDLPDSTPTEMWNTFESATSFVVLDTAGVYPGAGTAANGLTFTMGVDDPAGIGAACGQYDRFGQYQELQFMMANDIQFDNFTTVSVDVYMPSSNDYSGSLTKTIGLVIGEASQTDGWWNGHIQYDAEATVMDEWVTYTFQLDAPTSGAGSYTPYERTDLDFFAISLGGGDHTDAGTFYIRNFQFN